MYKVYTNHILISILKYNNSNTYSRIREYKALHTLKFSTCHKFTHYFLFCKQIILFVDKNYYLCKENKPTKR